MILIGLRLGPGEPYEKRVEVHQYSSLPGSGRTKSGRAGSAKGVEDDVKAWSDGEFPLNQANSVRRSQPNPTMTRYAPVPLKG
jgi:hypothetical protein